MATAKDLSIDNKIVKKLYPTSNMEDQLVFIFDSDPNLCMLKNKISIHFKIELPENYVPENGFASKQFSQLAVEINSQTVSNNKVKYDKIIIYPNFQLYLGVSIFLQIG